MSRSRLDVALVERGLVPSRARAQAVVAAGLVTVDGAVATRPAVAVTDTANVEVEAPPPFVSRGGEKLAGALDVFGIDVTGATALDLGASTGGFTDCLLQRGAARVTAVDVGYGQLAWTLRNDPRVTVMERTNARHLSPDDLPDRPDLVTCDLAFISVETVWPAVSRCWVPGAQAVVLVKPQFEVGKGQVGSGGVVRDPALHGAAIRRVADAVSMNDATVVGVTVSPLTGPKGNREFFIHAINGPAAAVDLDAAIIELIDGQDAPSE